MYYKFMYYKSTDDPYKNCIPIFLNNYYTFVNIQFKSIKLLYFKN